MVTVFDVLAEPHRRAILGVLARAQTSVGQLERELRLTQTTVSKHLRVLREAGLVEAQVVAQRRLYRLRPEPLRELDVWLDPFRVYWTTQVDALERYLDQGESHE